MFHLLFLKEVSFLETRRFGNGFCLRLLVGARLLRRVGVKDFGSCYEISL
jgi:hypothetical protein